MKFYRVLFLYLLIFCYSPLSNAYTTFASAGAKVGGHSYPEPSPYTVLPFTDGQTDSHTNAVSHAYASVYDQGFDANTESGYSYRRQAIASADASPGILKAYASAGYFLDGPNPPNNLGVVGVGNAEFTDTFSIFSSKFFVDINIEYHLSGSLQGLAKVKGGLRISSYANTFNINASEAFASPLQFDCSSNISSCTGKATISVPANWDISISGFLEVLAAANTDPNTHKYGDALANFGNTARIFISPVDPRNRIVSSSGFNYSPVPLPASIWLFGSALMGLVTRFCITRKNSNT
ncbi:MAG: PEP-CTERM sorting domain-containing protein [Methylococcaceae bacterium]|nr:PEP-CTERM sorting domain-containing protein [Methylococcaceae bacterium]MDZ4155885.1 PEP-CTERM sorting domain-containing protein [Methylococcales bacterium]MDP2392262.1 PEP-CTERM sorting domain-containing protein [Methylococcaceae bacterium]MDP3018995.1 PEP-CTERM sorting domain-containing protein [Methylococcaceae bacterium]MDP3391556.1 PEP-CTERM sorting domain-containing protein [Methylococcaceae bacterium]